MLVKLSVLRMQSLAKFDIDVFISNYVGVTDCNQGLSVILVMVLLESSYYSSCVVKWIMILFKDGGWR